MRLKFDPSTRVIRVTAEVYGPVRAGIVRMQLDTGAERSVIHSDTLAELGYRESSLTQIPVQGVTGTGSATPSMIQRLDVGGVARNNFLILSMDLPRARRIDGLLGMDFLQGTVVTINNVEGWVEISEV